MFKTPLKILLAASIAFPATLLTDVANAGPGRDRHHDRHKDRHHYSSSHYYGGHYYSPPRYVYYPNRYRYYGYHHSNAGKYLGLALLGLGVGYVLSKQNQQNQTYYSAPPPPQPGYNAPPQGYAQPQNNYQAQNFDFSQCQDTRDYQTTIYVDGQPQDAYGTACLMPDGTWVAGPMRLGN